MTEIPSCGCIRKYGVVVPSTAVSALRENAMPQAPPKVELVQPTFLTIRTMQFTASVSYATIHTYVHVMVEPSVSGARE